MRYVENLAGVTLDLISPVEEPRVSLRDGLSAIRNTMYGVAGGLALACAAVEYRADSKQDHIMAITLATYGAIGVLGGIIFSRDAAKQSSEQSTIV